MATQLFQAPHGTPTWFHRMVEKAASENRTITEHVSLTPALAVELLRNNPDNRTVSNAKLQKIVRDINAGDWVFNGEPILISKEGLLNDGQHRCNAVVETNKEIDVLLTFGLERSSRETLDQGQARTAGDYLTMQGAQHATSSAAIARFVIAYEASEQKSINSRAGISNAAIVARVHADPQIGASAQFAVKQYHHSRRLGTVQIFGFCHAVFSRINNADADLFMTQVCVGEDIRKTFPAFAVREGLMRERITATEKLHLVFRGWNAFRQKRKLELTKVTGANLPALV